MPLCDRAGLLLLTAVAWAAAGCGDRLHISNTEAGAEAGVLIDGRDSAGDLNDRGAVTSHARLVLGDLRAGASNEVIGFTYGHPPRLQATVWTAGSGDRFNLDFKPEIAIPVVVWIVKGPFADQRQRAIEACKRTSAIWYAERMGVRFSDFAVIDATKDPEAPKHCHFPNGDEHPEAWEDLRKDIGFVAGRLNVYSVETVDGRTGSGWSNFKEQIALGEGTNDGVLAHEIGHAFSLIHTTGNCSFDRTNIMWSSASAARRFFTEGQLFRAHFDRESVLNTVYTVRGGEPVRSCDPCLPDAGCPALQRRLWADGRFPPY